MRSTLFFKFTLIAIGNCIAVYSYKASNEVKVMDYQPHETDGNYFNSDFSETRIIRINDTYNRFQYKLLVRTDFPIDTEFTAVIARSRTEDGPWRLIATYASRLCDKTDEYHMYLPNFFINLTGDGKCIRKGIYETDDSGIFKFYDLLRVEDIDGYYFATINIIRIPGHTISMSIVRSESINAR